MDICELHNCTMRQLMLTDDIMDNFEYQAWVHRWHESRFGSRWDHYMIGQLIGYVGHLMGGDQWQPEDYMVTSDLSNKLTDPYTQADEAARQEQDVYQMMVMFKGKEAADKWKGVPSNANN